MKDKDLLKLHLQNGWQVIQKGEQVEVIPVRGKDVPTGLLNKIRKRTGGLRLPSGIE